MKLLPIIILVIFCSVCNAQTAAEDYTKPAHRFSIGLVGGSVLGNSRTGDLTGEHDYTINHINLGIRLGYHFTARSSLLFQPLLYITRLKQYNKIEDQNLSAQGTISRLIVPVYYNLHTKTPLKCHFYSGLYYSTVTSSGSEAFVDYGNGVISAPGNLAKGFISTYNNIGLSIGTGLSYSYKRWDLGIQLLCMIGFAKYNTFIVREKTYVPANAVLAYSFN